MKANGSQQDLKTLVWSPKPEGGESYLWYYLKYSQPISAGSVLGAWQHERSQKSKTLFSSNKCLDVLNSNLKTEILF
jgi:hypothetical protein